MRIINENYEFIDETDVDLTVGKLIPATVLREDAEPIDNISKWAWAEEDFEEVRMFIPNPPAMEREEISTEDTILDIMADHEYRLCLLELGGEA